MLKTKRIFFGVSIFILAIFLAGCAKNKSAGENNPTLPEKETNEETVSPGGLNINGGTSQKSNPQETNNDIKSKLEKLKQGQDSKLNVNESDFDVDDSDIDDKAIEAAKPEENIDDSDIDKL